MRHAPARLVLCVALAAVLFGCSDSSDDEQAGDPDESTTTFVWPEPTTVPWVEPTSLRTVDIPPDVTGALHPLSASEVLSWGDRGTSPERNWTWAVTDVEAGTTQVLDDPDFDGTAEDVSFDVHDGVGMLVARVCPETDEPFDWCHWEEGHLELWRLEPDSRTWTDLGSFSASELTGDDAWGDAEHTVGGHFDDDQFVVQLNDESERVEPASIAVDPVTGGRTPFEPPNPGPPNPGPPDRTCELADGTEVRIEDVEGWPLQTRRPGGEWTTHPTVAPAWQQPWCGETTAFVLTRDQWVQADADGNVVSSTTIPGFYDETGRTKMVGQHVLGEGTDQIALVAFVSPPYGTLPAGTVDSQIVIVSSGGPALVHEIRPDPSLGLPVNDREVRLPGGRIVMYAGTRYPAERLLVAE